MLSGRRAFDGASAVETMNAILKTDPPDLADIAPEVQPGIAVIMRRCLEKQPADRFQSARDLVFALQAITNSTAHEAASPTSFARKRAFRIAAIAVIAVAVTLGAFFGIRSMWQGARRYAPPPSKVAEANEYFQRAMLFLNTQQDLPRARQMLEKALALDPRFAYARAWYGFTHVMLVDSGQSNDTSLLYKAGEELRHALQDDPKSARAHASLAMVYLYQGRKELTPLEARRAIELDPNERDGFFMLAYYHQWNGEYEQSQAIFKSMLDSDPTFIPVRLNFGENLRQMGDPAGSIREQEKVLEQDPNNILALNLLALAHQTSGNAAGAREALGRARALEPQNYWVRLLWALELAIEGERAHAEREMDSEVLKYGELIMVVSNVAEFYAVLGDKAKSLDWLERAVRAGDERADWFERDPLLANIQDEPRFRQIVDGIRYRREQQAKPKR
jgi:Tfp pilus assembly protein PilF